MELDTSEVVSHPNGEVDEASVALLEESRRENLSNIEDTAAEEMTPFQRRLQELAREDANGGPTDEIYVGDIMGMGGSFSERPDLQTADVTVSLDTSFLPTTFSLNCLIKGTTLVSMTYLGLLISILIGGLVANGSATCEKPLITWASVESFLFVLMILKNFGVLCDMPARIARMDPNSTIRKILVALTFVGHRGLNFIWFLWFIFGAVWTMDVKSKCSDEAFAVWVTSLIVVVIQMGVAGLVGLSCCCMCLCFFLWYFVSQSRFEANRGASTKLIEKTTKTTVFSPDTSEIAKEDAVCAICLSEYAEGEKLRYLPCDHHFHSDCVDQWLKTNKSCASCRRLIDAEPPDEEKGVSSEPSDPPPPSSDRESV